MLSSLNLTAPGFVPANARVLARISRAAYDPVGIGVMRPADSRPNPSATPALVSCVDSRTDTHGFILEYEDAIVIAFRGTKDLRNWITDAEFPLRPLPGLAAAAAVPPVGRSADFPVCRIADFLVGLARNSKRALESFRPPAGWKARETADRNVCATPAVEGGVPPPGPGSDIATPTPTGACPVGESLCRQAGSPAPRQAESRTAGPPSGSASVPSSFIIQNSSFPHLPPPRPRVHAGFLAAVDAVLPGLVARLLPDNRDKRTLKPILLTGHSLGGALAVLCGFFLIRENFPVHSLYTFGQPRVGNRPFADAYAALLGPRTFRLVNQNDLVPRLPGWLLGYRHAGQLELISAGGALVENPPLLRVLLSDLLGLYAAYRAREIVLLTEHFMDRYLAALDHAESAPPDLVPAAANFSFQNPKSNA